MAQAPYQGLQQEAALCSLLVRHPHVVALYGVTRDEEQRPHLVAELAPYGSLKHLLSKLHDQGVLLSPMTILAMAQQARGADVARTARAVAEPLRAV